MLLSHTVVFIPFFQCFIYLIPVTIVLTTVHYPSLPPFFLSSTFPSHPSQSSPSGSTLDVAAITLLPTCAGEVERALDILCNALSAVVAEGNIKRESQIHIINGWNEREKSWGLERAGLGEVMKTLEKRVREERNNTEKTLRDLASLAPEIQQQKDLLTEFAKNNSDLEQEYKVGKSRFHLAFLAFLPLMIFHIYILFAYSFIELSTPLIFFIYFTTVCFPPLSFPYFILPFISYFCSPPFLHPPLYPSALSPFLPLPLPPSLPPSLSISLPPSLSPQSASDNNSELRIALNEAETLCIDLRGKIRSLHVEDEKKAMDVEVLVEQVRGSA